MTPQRKGIIVLVVSTIFALVSLVYHLLSHEDKQPSKLTNTHLRCEIELKSYNDTSSVLITGFNYYLLKQLAAEHGSNASISLSDNMISGIDSLKKGNIDILVIPFETKLHIDSVLISHAVDSQTVWLMRQDWKRELKELNAWIKAVHMREDFNDTRASFMKVYSPFRSRPRKMLSPYDSLIRDYADSISWDWRMMAAIIYQESHFHIEARSHRGAFGLMQMMPATAKRFGATDLLDPEQSIRAGANYLELLSGRYKRLAANPEERMKFVLAAYNAGGGRIRDCIIFARAQGIEPRYWDDILGIIPMMRDSAAVAQVGEVKLGTFQGYETINYVNRVQALYKEFCRIAPKEK